MVTSTDVTTGAASQASLTVGAGHTGAAGQLIGETTAAQLMLGAVMSCTTMVELHEAAFPQASVAVQVRVML